MQKTEIFFDNIKSKFNTTIPQRTRNKVYYCIDLKLPDIRTMSTYKPAVWRIRNLAASIEKNITTLLFLNFFEKIQRTLL